ncbi:MAG: hypothetical protein M1820_003971 [Bogoriella megaspora]|nr:MAG: hypothetical protein M1820_003971 [Bogoriella megaspora]
MAELHGDSDEELPDLQDIINRHAQKAWPNSKAIPRPKQYGSNPDCLSRPPQNNAKTQLTSGQSERRSVSSRKKPARAEPCSKNKVADPAVSKQTSKQATSVESLSLSALSISRTTKPTATSKSVRATPKRSAKTNTTYRNPELSPVDASDNDESLFKGSSSSSSDDPDKENSLHGNDLFNPDKSMRRRPLQKRGQIALGDRSSELSKAPLPDSNLIISKPHAGTGNNIDHSLRTKVGIDSGPEQDAFLKFSPPRWRSPCRLDASDRPSTPPLQRPCTPETSPAKNRLKSPSKNQIKMLTPPHRPSLDTFWDQDAVNGWKEQHSPQKVLHSPSKQRFLDSLKAIAAEEDGSEPTSPTTYPKKIQSRSPKKTDAEKRATKAKKTFESQKRKIADDFLEELDQKITNGKLREMANDGTGIKIEWSRKLNSTAGRAHWKRETRRDKDATGRIVSAEIRHRHEAKIELAEKVIDCEERLVNVITHEFCHLACFMINNIRDRPHGKEFKTWGRKCTTAFAHRNIVVTTKHSYSIDYKYIWACVECGMEYKRHSKSIDPTRHACGACKARLVQIKPPARGATKAKGPSEYQAFVKKVFGDVKRENPELKHGEIMERIGCLYREGKEEAKGSGAEKREAKVDALVDELEVLVIDD